MFMTIVPSEFVKKEIEKKCKKIEDARALVEYAAQLLKCSDKNLWDFIRTEMPELSKINSLEVDHKTFEINAHGSEKEILSASEEIALHSVAGEHENKVFIRQTRAIDNV